MKVSCDNITFIGGVHGVGKSTICKRICKELNIEYLSASQLLKWNELNSNHKNKKVEDIEDTQTRLIKGLQKKVKQDKRYLLDGHYCLFNKKNEITNVPLETFEQINPSSLVIILGEISRVIKRLEGRDNIEYDFENLEKLQNEELSYAKFLSKKLGITLDICYSDNYNDLINSLKTTLAT